MSLEHFIKDFYIPLVFDTFKKHGNKIGRYHLKRGDNAQINFFHSLQ